MIEEKIFELYLPYPDKDDRRVRVYVPAHKDSEKLPVIYMTDGQNLFDEKTATWGCWHTREAVRAERELSGKAAIIVGIHNDNKWRDNELTPKSIGEVSPEDMPDFTAPEGEIFDGFVINTVMPAVEAQFPVKKGRKNTAFCGSSSGGLQSFFTAVSHCDKFSYAGVFSPAFLLYSADDMRRWIYESLKPEMPYLYIYTGAGDRLEQKIFDSVEWTYDILSECYPPDMMTKIVLPEEKHHESAWEPIFRDFLHTFLNR